LVVLLLALDPVVAVVLLIGAVEFEDLNGIFCEVGGIFKQFAGEGFPQEITLLFNAF
jgi:hypothetical protein